MTKIHRSYKVAIASKDSAPLLECTLVTGCRCRFFLSTWSYELAWFDRHLISLNNSYFNSNLARHTCIGMTVKLQPGRFCPMIEGIMCGAFCPKGIISRGILSVSALIHWAAR